MEQYQLGDYVLIRGVKDKVYRIQEISERTVRLENQDYLYDFDDLQPIEIGSELDKQFYWDPIIAAFWVPDGMPIPTAGSGRDNYYLDALRNTFTEDGVSLYDKVVATDCQYVHEVQHVLNECQGVSDDLKISQGFNSIHIVKL